MSYDSSTHDTILPKKSKGGRSKAKETPPPKVEGAEFLAAIDKTGQSWDDNKTASRAVGRAYHNSGEHEKLAARITKCAALLGFARTVDEHGEIHNRLQSVQFCKARYCVVCQWRKSLFWSGRFKKAMPKIEQQHPGGRWLMLTLTVRNCDVASVREQIAKMNKAFRLMTRRKDWPALGFIRALEITRNPNDNTAHPHFHALLHVPAGYFSGGRYRTQAWWAEQWQKALGVDYAPIVDVRAAKAKGDRSATDSAAHEVLKYSVKPSDLTACPAWLSELTNQTGGLRYLATGGTLKDCVKEEVSEDEMQDTETAEDDPKTETELRRFVYQYWPKFKRYGRRLQAAG